MKKLSLFVCVLTLMGCQSEIDKCVDAKIVQLCAPHFPDAKYPENENIGNDKCGDFSRKAVGGSLREECLKARAGKE